MFYERQLRVCVRRLMVHAKMRQAKKPRKDHNKRNLLEVDNITNKTDKHRPWASIINLGTT